MYYVGTSQRRDFMSNPRESGEKDIVREPTTKEEPGVTLREPTNGEEREPTNSEGSVREPTNES